MKYFWVLFSQDNPGSLIADVYDFKGVDRDRLCVGEPVNDWNAESFVAVGEFGRDGTPDDVLVTGAGVPIFSERLRLALEEINTSGIQFLPIKVVSSSTVSDSFQVANLLNRLPLLDEDASDLRHYAEDYFIESRRGQVSGIKVPVLRRTSSLNGVEIFRLREFWAPVFVSQRFRDLFRLRRFTGIDFAEVATTDAE